MSVNDGRHHGIDLRLLDFATPRQREYVEAVNLHGSERVAAKELGVNRSSLGRALHSLRKKAQQQGYSPEHNQTHAVPETQYVKGVSTYYNEDGQVKGQWVKTSARQEQIQEVLRQFTDELRDEVEGLAKPQPIPKTDADDILTVYPMGDPHVGMYAWDKETGEDYDLNIAITDNRAATERLSKCAPRSKQAIIINVGDYFHADNAENRTRKSGHPLDVDTRISKVVRVGVDLMRYKIDCALKVHEQVQIRNAMGNHDEMLSAMLSLILEAYYKNEPRVTVDTSPRHVWYRRFGKNLIGVTHGDIIKLEDLNGVMAVDAAEDWGKTEHRYWYTGHIHHRRILELRGCVVESFRSLVARDVYTDSHGFRSGRDMYCIVLDTNHGEIERHRVDISMLRKSA